MTIDPTPFLEAAAMMASRVACLELRESGFMPLKVRVQLWCADPDYPGRYKNTEFETMIHPEAYEELYQAYMQRRQAAEEERKLKEEQDDPLDPKDVLNDVQQFISSQNSEPKSEDEGDTDDPSLLADDGEDGPEST